MQLHNFTVYFLSEYQIRLRMIISGSKFNYGLLTAIFFLSLFAASNWNIYWEIKWAFGETGQNVYKAMHLKLYFNTT